MGHLKANRPVALIIAAVLGAAVVGATLLSSATSVAQAQTEPATAANGVLLPPMDYDPVAARNEGLEGLVESAVAPATPTPAVNPTDGSTVTDAPVEATVPPQSGNSVTTSLGGSDVAVSSVGGSYEVDRPKKRSERRN